MRLVLMSLVLLGLQTTLLNDMRPFGVMVPLMLMFCVASGTLYGSQIGAISGLIVGVMYDAVLTTPLGLASLVFGAAAYVAGMLLILVREPTWWNRALAIGIMSAVGELLFPVARGLVGYQGWFEPHLFAVAGYVAVMTMVCAPIVLPLCRWTLKESLVG